MNSPSRVALADGLHRLYADELVLPQFEEITQIMDRLDPVRQQKLIELLAARHALHAARNEQEEAMVVDGLTKHIKQMIGKYRR